MLTRLLAAFLLVLTFAGAAAAQSTPPATTFTISTWDGIFASESFRRVKGNTQYPESGQWTYLWDSELIDAARIACLHYNADGGGCGMNTIVTDGGYFSARRRWGMQSLELKEVDDPPELIFARAPGIYPNTVWYGNNLNDHDWINGMICAKRWTNNGTSNCTNQLLFLELDGMMFRTTNGPNQAILRLWIGNNETTFYTPATFTDDVVVEQSLTVEGRGGNVYLDEHDVVIDDIVFRNETVGSCPAGEFLRNVYPSCDNGHPRSWRPRSDTSGEMTCSEPGYNRIWLRCAKK